MRAHCDGIRPSRFLSTRDYLWQLFHALKEAIPDYTYHRFSDDLGFASKGAAYMILHGVTALNKEKAEQLAHAMNLRGTELRYLQNLCEFERCEDPSEKQRLLRVLSSVRQKTLGESDRKWLQFYGVWHNAVIFEYIGLGQKCSDAKEINENIRYRIGVDDVKKSIALLTDLGLIEFDKDAGRFKRTLVDVRPSSDISNMVIVNFHTSMMDLARLALNAPYDGERQVASLTLSVPEEKFLKMTEEVKEFRDRLKAIAAEVSEEKSRVVQVNIQFLPVADLKGDPK